MIQRQSCVATAAAAAATAAFLRSLIHPLALLVPNLKIAHSTFRSEIVLLKSIKNERSEKKTLYSLKFVEMFPPLINFLSMDASFFYSPAYQQHLPKWTLHSKSQHRTRIPGQTRV